jgi:hypothetical protein
LREDRPAPLGRLPILRFDRLDQLGDFHGSTLPTLTVGLAKIGHRFRKSVDALAHVVEALALQASIAARHVIEYGDL